jgi:hypothetical protein
MDAAPCPVVNSDTGGSPWQLWIMTSPMAAVRLARGRDGSGGRVVPNE